ncbi:multicopper oxidase domain-containing protein [Streptomyces mangrovi]|uniref:multicopper oxidase domain-containing protein n=1 Tax=Streptomyces mangrovi TaxID=1206892 RepID=UPI00399D030F
MTTPPPAEAADAPPPGIPAPSESPEPPTPAGRPPGPRGGPPPTSTSRRAPLFGAVAGVLLTVLAVLVAGTPGGGVEAAGGRGADTTGASGTRTVRVELRGMRVSPATVEVPSGTRLVLEVVNRDAMRHDLRVEDGPATPMLGRGESARLDVGTVTADRAAWCTVAGHRAAGMSMRIAAGETGAGGAGGGEEHEEHAPVAGAAGPDLAAEFSPGWASRPAALPPAGPGRVHRVTLRTVEKDIEVAPGVRQRMWTFGGTVPGPTLRGRVGDTFEITLVNDGAMGHSVDFHAGALAPDKPMRTIEPGQSLVYRFTAERAGAWLYHCGTAPMLQHIANGMYGAVVIDPPGLPEVDREYLLVASQLYLGAVGGEEQVARMRANTPDAWAFNGVAGQYAREPLTARAGERVRFWVVAAGPGDGVAFHVVGTVFDTVYQEGAHRLRPEDPGGAQVLGLSTAQGGFVEAVFPEAGRYPFVDHDMRRAEAGAHGAVEVRR